MTQSPDALSWGQALPEDRIGGELSAALRRGDARTCRRLAEQAGALQTVETVAPLCELLAVRSRRRAWVWARIAAVNALCRIGRTDALPALTRALFDADPLVREAAAFALPCFGAAPIALLIRELRSRTDWPLQSMQLLITTLGDLGNRRALPALLNVLNEQLPFDPTRWGRQTFVRPFVGLLALFSGSWIVTLLAALPSLPGLAECFATLLLLIMYSLAPFLFFYMVLVCMVFVPLLHFDSVREREILGKAALEGLVKLKDRRAIPGILEAIDHARPGTGRATQALCSLLPLLRPEDAARFPLQAKRRLARLLENQSTEVRQEILRALELVGGGESIEAVERVAKQETGPIRSEARRLLNLLRDRSRQEQASSSLLRGSSSPGLPMAELLHPVESGTPLPPEELLRPDERPNPDEDGQD